MLLLVIAARLIVASAVQVEHAVLLILYPIMHLPACLLAAMNLRLVQWTDRLGVITAACAVIGALSLLAVPGAPLSPLMGLATGAIAGTALRTLQIAGWID